ncbi:MAG: PPC domain-containing protein [Cyanobacteria bacterium P01_F01_bin.150]
MRNTFSRTVFSKLAVPFMVPATLFGMMLGGSSAIAQTSPLYNPIAVPESNEITESLSDQDIPTGLGGFARDYRLNLVDGDHVVIDLLSDEFDTIVTLISPDGTTAGENDDGPDGSTNSMLFYRVADPGSYTIRVAPYAGQGFGQFTLKITRLRPI